MQDVIWRDIDLSCLSAVVVDVYIKEQSRTVVYSGHGIVSGCKWLCIALWVGEE